jgi:hypothetical protein
MQVEMVRLSAWPYSLGSHWEYKHWNSDYRELVSITLLTLRQIERREDDRPTVSLQGRWLAYLLVLFLMTETHHVETLGDEHAVDHAMRTAACHMPSRVSQHWGQVGEQQIFMKEVIGIRGDGEFLRGSSGSVPIFSVIILAKAVEARRTATRNLMYLIMGRWEIVEVIDVKAREREGSGNQCNQQASWVMGFG